MELNKIYCGNNVDVLKTFPDNSIDSVVTDPPYGISFMNKHWDYDVPSVETWKEVLRVLKPGGHALVACGTRTQHRMAVNLEDAGFEIRDLIAWIYGSGFPKSLDISKAIDKRGGKQVAWFGNWLRNWREENGLKQSDISKLFPSKSGGLTGCVANWELGFNLPTNEQFNIICKTFGLPFDSLEEAEREVLSTTNFGASSIFGSKIYNNRENSREIDITAPSTDEAKQWQGWGTSLKPAFELWTLCRKPFKGTVAQNVLEYGTGGLNIDGGRIGTEERTYDLTMTSGNFETTNGGKNVKSAEVTVNGRFPANVILQIDDSEYELKDEVSEEDKEKVMRWLYENS